MATKCAVAVRPDWTDRLRFFHDFVAVYCATISPIPGLPPLLWSITTFTQLKVLAAKVSLVPVVPVFSSAPNAMLAEPSENSRCPDSTCSSQARSNTVTDVTDLELGKVTFAQPVGRLAVAHSPSLQVPCTPSSTFAHQPPAYSELQVASPGSVKKMSAGLTK